MNGPLVPFFLYFSYIQVLLQRSIGLGLLRKRPETKVDYQSVFIWHETTPSTAYQRILPSFAKVLIPYTFVKNTIPSQTILFTDLKQSGLNFQKHVAPKSLQNSARNSINNFFCQKRIKFLLVSGPQNQFLNKKFMQDILAYIKVIPNGPLEN